MIISPNTDVNVITASRQANLVSLPGIFTPSEAFVALKTGATALKFFPAEASNPAALKAFRAILPDNVRILPVGGIGVDRMEAWLAAGAAGFGLGSALFKPGDHAAEVGIRAEAFVDMLKARSEGC